CRGDARHAAEVRDQRSGVPPLESRPPRAARRVPSPRASGRRVEPVGVPRVGARTARARPASTGESGMIRLAAFALALGLGALPFRTAPLPPVGVVSLLGLLLASVGIAALRRSLVTAAACVFLTDYAASLWLAGAPASLSGATVFGLLVLMLLQTVELAWRTR